MNIPQRTHEMMLAMEEARLAADRGEVPVGCAIFSADGTLLARAGNRKEEEHNPCAHAEILAIEAAARTLQSWRLLDCRLLVTLEPCPMCLAAMREARIAKLIFGAYDPKGGALSLGYALHADSRTNHQFSVLGGIGEREASRLLSDFFRRKRS